MMKSVLPYTLENQKYFQIRLPPKKFLTESSFNFINFIILKTTFVVYYFICITPLLPEVMKRTLVSIVHLDLDLNLIVIETEM